MRRPPIFSHTIRALSAPALLARFQGPGSTGRDSILNSLTIPSLQIPTVRHHRIFGGLSGFVVWNNVGIFPRMA